MVVDMEEGWLIATDASGGEHTADPRLRRVGAAVVIMDSETYEMKWGHLLLGPWGADSEQMRALRHGAGSSAHARGHSRSH